MKNYLFYLIYYFYCLYDFYCLIFFFVATFSALDEVDLLAPALGKHTRMPTSPPKKVLTVPVVSKLVVVACGCHLRRFT